MVVVGYNEDMTMNLDDALLDRALAEVGTLLAERGVTLELCVIGGAAFVLQDTPGFVATADLDIAAQIAEDGTLVAPVPLPPPLADAIQIVAHAMGLGPHWINSAAAAAFGVCLPEGFLARARRIQHEGLVLHVGSRQDLIALKLLAALRRGQPGDRHRDDLIRARATDQELEIAAAWARERSTDQAASEPRLIEVLDQLRTRRDA
jgi:hypothetical protein